MKTTARKMEQNPEQSRVKAKETGSRKVPKKVLNPESIFKRTEVKYRIPHEVYDAFMEKMAPYIHIDDFGLTTICNIYYDTDNHDLISRSLSKPSYKEKLRVRSYGVPGRDTTVFVELKKKYAGIVYKRREAMPYYRAEAFMNAKIRPEKETQIIRELAYARDFYDLKPALYLAYDREAYVGTEDSGMRFTFDKNIRYRTKDLHLGSGDEGTLLAMNQDVLMEVKVNRALPMEIVHIFNEFHIYPSSFSKYGAIYKEMNQKPAWTA